MDALKPLSPEELSDAKGVSAVLSRLDDGESVQSFRVDRIGTVFVIDKGAELPTDAPAGSLAGRIDETTGFLHIKDSKIARSGTLVYSDGRQEWREFRSDATIAQAAESFSGVVFTHNHPPVMVTKDNVSQFQAGQVTNARKVGKFLVADEIIITRPSAIDRAQQPGGWELSIGFLTDVVRRDGVHDQQAFSFEQLALEGNHVAGVDEGRAGPEIRLAMDSAFSITALIEPDAPTTPPTADAEENTMKPEEKKDGAPKETPEVQPAPAPKAPVIDAAPEPKPKADETPLPEKEPRVDHAKLVRDRVSLIRAADLVLDSVDDSADDKTIRLAVIAKVHGNDAIAGHESWDEGYLRGSFDSALASHKRPTVDTAQQIAFMTGGRVPQKDGAGEAPDFAAVHAAYTLDMRNAHLKPAAHTEPKHG